MSKSEVDDHKTLLNNLQSKDPDFYRFLREQDAELLNFEVSSDSESETAEAERDEKGDKRLHKPAADEIELPSDLSDISSSDEDDDEKKEAVKEPVDDRDLEATVSMKHVKRWNRCLSLNRPSPVQIMEVCKAFQAAVQTAGVNLEDANISSSKFHVPDGTIFNGVIRLCFTKMKSAWLSAMSVKNVPTDTPVSSFLAKSSQWKSMKKVVKLYLILLSKLIDELNEPDVIAVSLQHVNELVAFYGAFPKIARQLIKSLIKTWSRNEESCRIVAFIALVKLVRMSPNLYYEKCLKMMFAAYVQNTKQVSPNTWPCINFMQHSYAELCALDTSVAYQHIFVYIKQLAIHLRNSIVSKKKDQQQIVQAWEFVLCLYLWARVLAHLHEDAALGQLVYPLVQVAAGAARLHPSQKHIPYRLHTARALSILSKNSDQLLPNFSIILECLELCDFNRKTHELSLKPFLFDCMLKCSKQQLKDGQFKQAVVDQVEELLMEEFHNQSKCFNFPEILIPVQVRIHQFTRRCKYKTLCRPFKEILTICHAHSKFILELRSKEHFSFSEQFSISEFERKLGANVDSPFEKFYQSWKKIRERILLHRLSQKTDIVDADIQKVPRITAKQVAKRAAARSASGAAKSFADVLEGDTSGEDSSDEETNDKLKSVPDHVRFLPPEKRPYKQSLKNPLKFDESTDSDSEEGESSKKKVKKITKPKKKVVNVKKHKKIVEIVQDTVKDFVLSDSD